MTIRCGALLLAMLLACPAAAAAAPPSRNQSLRLFLRATFAEARADYAATTYVSAYADLNGDGRDEALVSLRSGYFCGSGGCALYIFTPAGTSWRQVAELTIVNLPVRLLSTRHRGWHDLAVMVRGGGVDRPREARIRFDGRTYASNPSLAPRILGRVPGRLLIGEGSESRPLF